MKLFEVRYRGLWLGGKSIVFAENKEEAIELVRCHPNTVEFTDVLVNEIEVGGIVHNDNGDY